MMDTTTEPSVESLLQRGWQAVCISPVTTSEGVVKEYVLLLRSGNRLKIAKINDTSAEVAKTRVIKDVE